MLMKDYGAYRIATICMKHLAAHFRHERPQIQCFVSLIAEIFQLEIIVFPPPPQDPLTIEHKPVQV